MVLSAEFKITGQESVIRGLSRVSNKLPGAYERVLRGLVESFSNYWQVYAPVDTGALRRSGISRRASNIDVITGKFARRFGSSLPYAAIQEFADHFAHPKGGQAHYAQRSLTDTRSRANSIYKSVFGRLLR